MLALQQAFDTADHAILGNKLEFMGIGSTDWFKSYLSNRTQKGEVKDVKSDSLTVTCGKTQRSILGPLLFVFYVNDMKLSVSCKLQYYYMLMIVY